MARAISLWQPWASLWCSGRKAHETRHWKTDYRGWLLVHAARKIVFDQGELDEIAADEFGPHWGLELPRGAIIGRVVLVACLPTSSSSPASGDDLECGDWTPGRFAWRATEHETFARPIPYKGHQSFFDVPESILP